VINGIVEGITHVLSIVLSIYGGSIVMGVPQMDGLEWKIPTKNGWYRGNPFRETSI
jgi:hypothetical protein